MTSIIIGGAGFIGSHLADELISIGDHVVALDNMSLGNKKNIQHISDNVNFKLIEMDVLNVHELIRVFNDVKPDYIYHLAANSNILASENNPEIEYRNTYTTTYNVLVAMREFGVKNLFFASSSAVYGDKKNVMLSENTPNLSPISYYGAAKLGSEALISAFTYMNNFHSLVFRFPNVVGSRLTHGVVYDFIHKLIDDPLELEILGDGKQKKPYIFVKDLVRAITKFRDISQGVTIYNVGVNETTSVIKIADIVCEEMGLRNVNYYFAGREKNMKGDIPRYQYDLTRIHSTGWKAEYESDEAIRMSVKSLIKDIEKNI